MRLLDCKPPVKSLGISHDIHFHVWYLITRSKTSEGLSHQVRSIHSSHIMIRRFMAKSYHTIGALAITTSHWHYGLRLVLMWIRLNESSRRLRCRTSALNTSKLITDGVLIASARLCCTNTLPTILPRTSPLESGVVMLSPIYGWIVLLPTSIDGKDIYT